jgi:sporulation protein YabP
MEKNDEISTSHNLSMNNRNNLLISGVKKIENFDNEEFVMDTVMGLLTIHGNDLELIKLDTIQGDISIKGRINSINYKDDMKIKNNQGIINRLFK